MNDEFVKLSETHERKSEILMPKTPSNKNAVFIMFGQSNAVGYATLMPESERIEKPLKNVFGLTRKNNLSFDNNALVWTPYTSAGTILGEENDHTFSVSNCLARLWQNAIDEGIGLPNLYIITIAIGAQGVTEEYMWYPDRPKKLVPGPLGVADISLCPLAEHILSLLDDSFHKMGEEYEIIGLHWRGGEEEMNVPKCKLECELKQTYSKLFGKFYANLKIVPPVILHRIVCEKRAMEIDPSGCWLERMNYINSVFSELMAENENISLFDVRDAPFDRIFLENDLHFTPEANRWVAKIILDGYVDGLSLV